MSVSGGVQGLAGARALPWLAWAFMRLKPAGHATLCDFPRAATDMGCVAEPVRALANVLTMF